MQMVKKLTGYTYGNKTFWFGFVSGLVLCLKCHEKNPTQNSCYWFYLPAVIYASTNFFCIDGVVKVDNPN